MPNVLLVDASLMTRRFVELTFAREQIRVIAAVDGVKGIDLARAERPDVVLADHQAPALSGYELAAQFKQDPGLSRIPVLLIAGAYDDVDADRVSSSGCAGVLVKPLDPAQLVARVRQLMRPDPLPAAAVAEEDVAPPPRRTDRPGTVEELFDRLDAVLGERRRAPTVRRARETQDDPSEGDALPTLDRLLGSAAPVTGQENASDESLLAVSNPEQHEGSREEGVPGPPAQGGDEQPMDELKQRLLDRLTSDRVEPGASDTIEEIMKQMAEAERARLARDRR